MGGVTSRQVRPLRVVSFRSAKKTGESRRSTTTFERGKEREKKKKKETRKSPSRISHSTRTPIARWRRAKKTQRGSQRKNRGEPRCISRAPTPKVYTNFIQNNAVLGKLITPSSNRLFVQNIQLFLLSYAKRQNRQTIQSSNTTRQTHSVVVVVVLFRQKLREDSTRAALLDRSRLNCPLLSCWRLNSLVVDECKRSSEARRTTRDCLFHRRNQDRNHTTTVINWHCIYTVWQHAKGKILSYFSLISKIAVQSLMWRTGAWKQMSADSVLLSIEFYSRARTSGRLLSSCVLIWWRWKFLVFQF